MVCGGIHGNEPSGTFAAKRVLQRLRECNIPFRGRFLAVSGNIAALTKKRRYIERDLNRGWIESHIRWVMGQQDATLEAEEQERKALAQILTFALNHHHGPVTLLDLHSFSAEGPPFAIMADTLRNRKLAFALPIPKILGLEETVEGTLLEYFAEQGHTAIAVEGGQHNDPMAVNCHEASIWLALEHLGCIRRKDVEGFDDWERTLVDVARGFPKVVEVIYRHGLTEADRFAMRPGYTNFQNVAQEEILASNHCRDVKSPMEGRILMPLYQEQGDDGFFLSRPVRMFWLRLSKVLRQMRLEKLLIPILPGVHRLAHHQNFVYVNPKIARWFVVEIFHLLGYRLRQPRSGNHIFSRRPQN